MAAKRMIATDIVAVIIGGIVGTVITNFFVALFTDGVSFQALLLNWGRYVVAIALTASFWFFYEKLPTTVAAIVSLAVGIVVPSVLAKVFFGAGDVPWIILFAFNAIFAVSALLVYRWLHAFGKGAFYKADGFRA